MKHNIRTAIRLFHFSDFKFGRTVASPLHRLSTFLITACNDIYTLTHHECRVETKTEVTDNCICIILIAFKEVSSTREGNLIDILFNLFGRHTNTAVADGKRLCLGINLHLHGQVAQFTAYFATRTECLQLLRRINGICHYFTKEYFVIAVQKLLDDGEDVLRSYSNLSFFHK